jgi:AcrR family transcriptional regulator
MKARIAPSTKARAARSASSPAAKPAAEGGLVPSRKQNILRAAERLFAARGFHGVSIRDIAEEAGVPLALVGYHYGLKVDLYHEIYRQRCGYVQERLQTLERAQREAPPGLLLEEIVKAFVLPVLKVAAAPDGRTFLRLISRGMNDQLAEDEPVIRELFDPLAHAFIDAMMAAAPQATRGTVAWCYQFALGALLHHVLDTRVERLSRGECRAGDANAAGVLLVRFITGGIRAACCPPVH